MFCHFLISHFVWLHFHLNKADMIGSRPCPTAWWKSLRAFTGKNSSDSTFLLSALGLPITLSTTLTQPILLCLCHCRCDFLHSFKTCLHYCCVGQTYQIRQFYAKKMAIFSIDCSWKILFHISFFYIISNFSNSGKTENFLP